MSKLVQMPSFQTTDNTVFTGPDAEIKASEHQAKLDNGAAIEDFIVANKLVKSAAGAARNMLPKFVAFMEARKNGAPQAEAVAAQADGVEANG